MEDRQDRQAFPARAVQTTPGDQRHSTLPNLIDINYFKWSTSIACRLRIDCSPDCEVITAGALQQVLSSFEVRRAAVGIYNPRREKYEVHLNSHFAVDMQQPQEQSQSTQGSEADSSVDLEAATPPVASLEIPTKTTQEKADFQSPASASNGKVDEKLFDRFTPRRKAMITLVVSVGAFMPPMGSTMLLSAIPQIATHFETSATLINYSNALYMLAAGMSPFFVATLSSVYGRKKVCHSTLRTLWRCC